MAKTLQPGWQRARRENFADIVVGRPFEVDLVADGGIGSEVYAPGINAFNAVLECGARRVASRGQAAGSGVALRAVINVGAT